VWLLAVFGAVAALLSRALAPALRGVWLGTDRAIEFVEGGAGLMSQLFAVSAAAVTVGMISALLGSGLASRLKVAVTLGGGLSVLAVMVASAARLHRELAFVYGTAAVVAALRVTREAARYQPLRGGALVVGSMATAGMVRLIGMAAVGFLPAVGAAGRATDGLAPLFIRGAATLSFGFETLAVGLAAAWLARGSSRPRAVVVALGLGSLAGYALVELAVLPDASGAVILSSRLVESLLSIPAPAVGHGARVVVEVGAWLVLFGVLSRGAGGRMLGACIALSLVARAAPERPLCALALVVAALGLALDRSSPACDLSILEVEGDPLLRSDA
jgi:hypothetical protein